EGAAGVKRHHHDDRPRWIGLRGRRDRPDRRRGSQHRQEITSAHVGLRHCGSMPAFFTTSLTLAISRLSAWSKTWALPPAGSMPAAVSCRTASGVLTAAIASAVILSVIACGRPGRAYRPTMVARS